jgi:hypothetical protein
MLSDPGELRIRNQRYPRWITIAENVFVGGMLVSFLAIEIAGLWLFGQRALYFLLAAFLLVLPIAIYGWLLLWDLNRPGPRRDMTMRALFVGAVLGIRQKGFGDLGAAVESIALNLLRPLLPTVHTVSQLKLGEKVEVLSAVRFPAQWVSRVRFALDPGEDFKESEPPIPLCEATVEIESGRQFLLIVTQADAERLRQWASAKGITVVDSDEYRSRTIEPAGEVARVES